MAQSPRRKFSPEQLISDLTREHIWAGPFPKKALQIASRHREQLLPVFLQKIDAYLKASERTRLKRSPMPFIFLLLGEWRDPIAYRPVARLLHCPEFTDDGGFDEVFDDIGHKVMVALFDGDPTPLFELAMHPETHSITRGNTMAQTLRILAAQKRVSREVIADFLVDAVDHLQDGLCAWSGWADLAASLNLPQFKPLLRQANLRHILDDAAMKDFDTECAKAAARGNLPVITEDDEEFTNAVDELEPYFSRD